MIFSLIKKIFKKPMIKFIIDAGHGGKDPGAVYKNLNEKDIVLKIALKIKEINSNCFLVRHSDNYIDLNERIRIINNLISENRDYKILLSLHMNSGGATGAEIYYCKLNPYSEKAGIIGKRLIDSYCEKFQLKNRGLKECLDAGRGYHFAMVRRPNIISLLLELAFIEKEGEYINSKTDEIAKFLNNFLSNLELLNS